MPVYSSLTHALAAALVDVLWFTEGSEDEQDFPVSPALRRSAHLL